MSPHTSTPKFILGTMTFGLEGSSNKTSAVRLYGLEASKPLIALYKKYGHRDLDTARIYCNGDTEIMLSQLSDLQDFTLATKVFPDAPHAHNKENLTKTFRASLDALKVDSIDLFYLHAPDPTIPIEETLEAVNELHKQGLFRRFGVSNYSAAQVEEIIAITTAKGYIAPSVYQGIYNPLARGEYLKLRPVLKKNNMHFYAYNPLAGGFLTGNFKFDTEIEKGSRFDKDTAFGTLSGAKYFEGIFFDAVEGLKTAAQKDNISLVEATFRWLKHHSGFDAQDGIITGVSSEKQLKQNLDAYEGGPLSQQLQDEFEKAWQAVQYASPAFYIDGKPSYGRLEALEKK